MGKYVTLIEIGKKQNYIFSSNRLAENVGASLIIKRATEQDTQEAYQALSPDVIYEGGGNALYVFKSKEDGMCFAKEYSKRILANYPGITLYLVGEEVAPGSSVKETLSICYELLAKKKNERKNAGGIIDFGGTVRCDSTNLPAVPYEKDRLPDDLNNRPLSSEALIKYENSIQGNLIQPPQGYRFPRLLDELGRSDGEKSYIAVVHIDGNQMGNKIRNFNESMIQDAGESMDDFDKRYAQKLGELSRAIREKYEEAFREMVDHLVERLKCDEKLQKSLDLKAGNLPIRPLIIAGDDICFVSDGRIGVELARVFIENIQKKEIKGIPLNACGGVALVKTHYPFALAYELAEELCQNGKDMIPEGQDASYLDWHLEQGELKSGLREIREDYIAEDNALLTLKPFMITKDKNELHGYPTFLEGIKIVQNSFESTVPGSKDTVPRSKMKGYRDILHKGKKIAEYYLKSNNIEGIFDRTDYHRGESGFSEADGTYYSLYYDAIEMADLYISLGE